ncbi:helix-hairpin-helix domain-containing protein [Agrobacterium tumefaciens]|nr:helix-hairpin-helix domain-containing protein [Agrobacterium tumefaciens]NTE23093.1 helix-hairpin-helix domain-containing protein [Agrobacterium tumefaciens]
MRIWLNKYFGFSKSEFNGLIILLFILFLLKIVPYLYIDFKPIEKDSPNLLAQIKQIKLADDQNFNSEDERKELVSAKRAENLFNFDPNTLNVEGWQSLGLSFKQAKSIVNYTDKGGKFYKPEDLKKMYVISPERYIKLMPYIQIEKNITGYPHENVVYEKKVYLKKPLQIIDINTADSAQLDEVKGIGGAFATRILKYRERLGGFHKKEQLMEVYGLDSVKYNEIKDQISMSTVTLKVININTAVFNDLKTNPYLSYKQINAIIQYRKQHGNYINISDLKKIAILNQKVIDQIAPYFSF